MFLLVGQRYSRSRPDPPIRFCFPFVIILGLGAVLGCDNSLRAALLVSEDFAYENASLIDGLNGGSGWAGPWSGIGFTTPGSLRYPQLAFSGNKATSQGSKCAFRKFSTPGDQSLTENGKFGKDNSTIWISFLINAPAGSTIPGYGGISFFEEGRERLFIGDTGASNVWAIERQGQTQTFSARVADSNICFVVCRIKFLPGPERVDLWIDPPIGVAEPSEAQVAASIDTA